jgi:hypothetical protein
MFWIEDACVGIEKIVVHKHLIPSGDKVGVQIVSDLQVSVHTEETGQGAVD